MCYVIDSRQLLANSLKTRSTVTVTELKDLARHIREEVPGVSVDLSHYSLSAALESYANMFERQDETTIAKASSSQSCFEDDFLDVFFNQEIPSEIRSRFLDCIGPASV